MILDGMPRTAADIAALPGTFAYARPKPRGGSTTAVRHALRALARDGDFDAARRGVEVVRPLVAHGHETLRERLEAGGSVEDYLRGRAGLADSTVVGLLHVAAAAAGLRSDSMIAPLAAVAVGGYGRRELAPGSDLDLLFLLPERDKQTGIAAASEACIGAVIAGLWDLGFVVDHAARSPRECLALAHAEPTVLASLLDRRLLWGGFTLFAALEADLVRLFSGPCVERWKRSVGAAARRDHRALDISRPLETEPDVKRAPGGLLDLQAALAASALTSGRPAALAGPSLIEAHHFLWLVRCHLHLLVGRTEDHLSSVLQPAIARRLALAEPKGTTVPPLLRAFRRHADHVLEAASLALH